MTKWILKVVYFSLFLFAPFMKKKMKKETKIFDPHITSQFPNQKIFPIFYVYKNDYLLSSVHTYSKWNFYVIIIISKFKKFENSVLQLGSIEIWACFSKHLIWQNLCIFLFKKISLIRDPSVFLCPSICK